MYVCNRNQYYFSDEVQRQIELSGPKLLIGQSETIPCLKEALFLTKKNLPIIAVKGSESNIPLGTISFEELAVGDNVDYSVLKKVSRNFEDIVFLPYSSGTTGLPKGVELAHKQMVVNCLQQDLNTIRHYDETTSKFLLKSLMYLLFLALKQIGYLLVSNHYPWIPVTQELEPCII